jgi:hypothetical protein
MRSLTNIVLLGFALVASLCIGCSAPPDDDAETAGGGENEIVRGGRLLGEVGELRVNGVAITSPEKIDRILDNLGLRTGDETTREEVDLGGVPQYLLSFHRRGGEFIASGHFIYIDGEAGSRERKNAKGSLQYYDKSYSLTARDLDAIDAIAKESDPTASGARQ